MTVASGVSVHCFPSTDAEFRETAQRLVGSSEGAPSIEGLIADVQAALRELYPEAIVRVRDSRAEFGEPLVQTIYAFRDGRVA